MQSRTENRLPLEFFPSHLIIKSSKWYTLESLVPWQEIEELLSPLFSDRGRNAIPVRQIIGALIIQTHKNLSDRETLETIMETPMLQYFLGLDDYIMEELFDHTLLCKYRQKIGLDIAKDMIDALLSKHKVGDPTVFDQSVTHAGSLSIDATVVPVNITYPTDLKLLNQVREETEEIIDVCHKASAEVAKPRTYRKEARQSYLAYAKAKRLSNNKRRTALRQQLQYVKRNINTIQDRLENGIYTLSEAMEESFSICRQIYLQQQTMWDEKTNRTNDRIVSLHQPHIRCIVRGKVGNPFEFGPKIAVGKVNGYIKIHEFSFANFNESATLKPIVIDYFEQYGVYPEVIRADRIYQTRENKVYCSSLGIRLSGKPLGRPRLEDKEINQALIEEDFKKRLEIEGVFGVAKTRFGLAKLMTKLPESQKASIGLVFFVMNLLQVLSFTPFFEAIEMLVFEVEINHEVFVYQDEKPIFKNTV
jgi:transposase, IS5 family